MTAPVFQSLPKSLAKEIHRQTLELYRSLLKSSRQFEGKETLKNQITASFKENKHTLSKQKLTQQIEVGIKAQACLSSALNGDEEMLGYVQRYINNHRTKKKVALEKKGWDQVNTAKKLISNSKNNFHFQLLIGTKKDKKRLTERKPYQVAIETKTSNGYTFKRVRGWVQPISTSMMLKKRVIQNQKSIDRLHHFQQQLEWIKAEQIFLSELDINDNLDDYGKF